MLPKKAAQAADEHRGGEKGDKPELLGVEAKDYLHIHGISAREGEDAITISIAVWLFGACEETKALHWIISACYLKRIAVQRSLQFLGYLKVRHGCACRECWSELSTTTDIMPTTHRDHCIAVTPSTFPCWCDSPA